MSAPSVATILAQPSAIPPEEVIMWRQKVGSQLAAIWSDPPEHANSRVLVIFGNNNSNRPLATPLFRTVLDHQDDDLEASALEYWGQMWMHPDPHVQDFELSMQHMRVVVVTSSTVSLDLIWDLLSCVRDNAADNLPDYMLTT